MIVLLALILLVPGDVSTFLRRRNVDMPQDRAPVPDEATRKQADKLVREIFKDELARTGIADRTNFIRKLIQQAAESKADPASCYVLLALAQDQAGLLGDADLLWKAADDAGAIFQVDPAVLKEAGVQKFSLRTPEDTKRAIDGFLRVAPEFSASGDFARAEKAGATAAALARRIKDVPSTAKADAVVKEAAALKDKFKGLPQARTTLTTQPDDPVANTLVGRYDCLVRGDWAAGLPRLARGSDAALKEAAANELAADPAKKAAVGDAWSALAEKESGPLRLAVLRHAAALYRAALPGLSGLTKLKLEKRIEEIFKESGVAEDVDLLRLIDVDKDRMDEGVFTRKGSSLATGGAPAMVEVYYAPPDEYDLKATAERKPGGGPFLIFGLVVGGHQCCICIDQDGKETGLATLGKETDVNPTIVRTRQMTADREYRISVSVRKTGVVLLIDGRKVIDWKGDPGKLSRNPAIPLKHADTLYFAAAPSWEIRQLVLVPLSGPGKSLR